MVKSNFFAMIMRMKYINRWGLMKNTTPESLSLHTLDTTIIADMLWALCKKNGKIFDRGEFLSAALYHDAPEILTGDLPTPVKYLNPEIKKAYKAVEKTAEERLIDMLPPEIKGDLQTSFKPSAEVKRYIKVADKLSALIKCIEEEKAGNSEFKIAKDMQIKAITESDIPEAIEFMELFIDGLYKTLDELK